MARSTDKRWKGILIDWPTIADFDIEDYELKPLNQQQVAILLALLEYQKWPTRWVGLEMSKDELETYIADIEERLMRNEAGMSIDYDALKNAIRDGMYEFGNDIAKQIVSGRVTNINVDDDGAVTDPTDGAAAVDDLPEDDPTTPIDETDAAHYGGVFSVGTKVEEVLDKIDSIYGVTNGSPAKNDAYAVDTLGLLYPFDETLLTTAVLNYYNYRIANNQLAFNGGTDFFQHLFCNGYDINSINRFMINVRTFATEKTMACSMLLGALLPSFWSQHFDRGVESPSTLYVDAACVKTPAQEHLIVPLNSNRQFFGLKATHRILLTFKGYVTDSDGDLQDSFWFRTAAGVLTRSNPTFGYGAGVAQPTDNQVPYNTSHIYQFTMELPNASTTMTINIGENAGIGTPIYQAEQFTIQFEDFGLPVGS